MATGMDTTYSNLPIRKYVDTIEDMAVPTRGTKRPVHNHTRQLSPFERLPLEIRQQIYERLGFPVGGKIWTKIYTPNKWLNTHATITRFFFPRWDMCRFEHGDVEYAIDHPLIEGWYERSNKPFVHLHIAGMRLLLVSKAIRQEVWDTMFSCTDFVIGFQVSSKAVHFSYPHSKCCYGNSRPKGFYRMHFTNADFANLTMITLTDKCGHTWSTNNPHELNKVSPRAILVRQALSIRYIADHCRFLTTFRIQPYLLGSVEWTERRRLELRGVAPKATEAMALALCYLVDKCVYLEVVKIKEKGVFCTVEDHDDQKECEHYESRFWERECEFHVPGVECLERLDKVEEWVRGVLDRLRTHRSGS